MCRLGSPLVGGGCVSPAPAADAVARWRPPGACSVSACCWDSPPLFGNSVAGCRSAASLERGEEDV